MNTIQLECFLAVSQFLNFSKAAEAVKLTQPAVSHQINTLEDELGTRLFVRNSKSVALTLAGLQFIGDADNILKIAKSARNRLSDPKMNDAVFFNIGCHDLFELNLLPPVIGQLYEEFPLLHPSVRMIPFQVLENLLESESLQVIMTFKNEQQNKAVGIYQELVKCPISCICTPAHPLAAYSALTVDQLSGPIALIEPRKGPPPVFKIHNHLITNRQASQLYFGDGYEGTMALVKSGIAFTLYPDLSGAREPGLCYIPVIGLETISFGVTYKSKKNNDIMKRFLQLSKDIIGTMTHTQSY